MNREARIKRLLSRVKYLECNSGREDLNLGEGVTEMIYLYLHMPRFKEWEVRLIKIS